jgi:FKBP-type peptidyl-prolyl cis-trans isomerase
VSSTSPQNEGRTGPVAAKWGLLTLLLVAAAGGLAFAGTQPFVSNPAADYLAENKEKPGVKTTASGLQYEVVSAGAGESPIASDTVAVHYRGTLTDGTQFDSSYERGQPAIFRLDQVIPGWTEGVQLMKPGAKYKFVLPPNLGYGPEGAPPVIPPNAVLLFDVELLAIKPRE